MFIIGLHKVDLTQKNIRKLTLTLEVSHVRSLWG